MSDFSKYGIPSDEWLRVEESLPPPPANLSIEELKRASNATRETAAQDAMKAFSGQVTLQDYSIPTRDGQFLEARVYRPSSRRADEVLPIYIHLHGGGFLFGTLSSEDATCSRVAINVETAVVNVNYRHTPEHPYPTAWNDAEDALQWISAHSALFHGDHHRLVIGGVSAGGWLTASLVQAVRRGHVKFTDSASTPTILGQVLMIPCLVYSAVYESQLRQIRDPSLSSYKQCAEAPILNTRVRSMFNGLLKIENPDPNDRRLSPGNLTAEEAKALPPTTLGIAGYDPLRDEALLYGKLLSENE